MLKKSPLILLIIILVNVSVFAQKGSNRIEFDVKDDYENEQTYPMGSFGIIQEAIAEDANDGQVEIKSELYSTDLVLKKSFSILIKSRSKIEDHFEEDGVHYSLYRGPRDYIAIVTLDTKNLTCTKVEGEYKDSDPFENMKVANGKAVFKTNHSKISILVIVDLKTGATKGIPFRIEDYGRTDVTIEDYQVYDNEILTFVNAKKNSKNIDLFIWKLNYNGDQTEFYNVTSGIEEKLITVQATKIEEKYVLTGTFSRNKQATSQGIFIAEVANKKLNFMKFYNFLELKNFKDYLPQKQQDKIERQKERKEGYGKELLLDFNIATHPIISTKDGYEFLGEAYKPTYRTTSTGMGMNGMSNYTTVFDGYQYTHAVLAKFDKQGKLYGTILSLCLQVKNQWKLKNSLNSCKTILIWILFFQAIIQ